MSPHFLPKVGLQTFFFITNSSASPKPLHKSQQLFLHLQQSSFTATTNSQLVTIRVVCCNCLVTSPSVNIFVVQATISFVPLANGQHLSTLSKHFTLHHLATETLNNQHSCRASYILLICICHWPIRLDYLSFQVIVWKCPLLCQLKYRHQSQILKALQSHPRQ